MCFRRFKHTLYTKRTITQLHMFMQPVGSVHWRRGSPDTDSIGYLECSRGKKTKRKLSIHWETALSREGMGTDYYHPKYFISYNI